MQKNPILPIWSIAAPLAGCLLLAGHALGYSHPLLLCLGLISAVLAAVHHAEVVAHRVGEPYGTLVLAIAITLIEVALIVSLMLSGGEAAMGLARDTVFAAVMIIMNGIVGLCLLSGGARHKEQNFGLQGVNTSLATLIALLTLTLVLPNFTSSVAGPSYSSSQLIFIAIVSLILYGTFIFMQTIRHRDYFLPEIGANDESEHAAPPSTQQALLSTVFLVIGLVAVVLLAKSLAPVLESTLNHWGAPPAFAGVVIAAVILLPEGMAALRAARANRLQTSMNLALGSALASIGLTIPVVALVALSTGWTLTLGIDSKLAVLLGLTLIVSMLSLGTGRTTFMQGVIHLVILATYLFTALVP